MIRADVQMSYFRKFLWIAIACVAGIGWCAFDAWVTYPKKMEIAKAFESLPDTDEGLEQWTQLAEKNGWSPQVPSKSSQEVQGLVNNQYLMILCLTVVGMFMFLKWYLPRGSWIEGDENHFQNSRGKRVDLDSLVSIDTTRWEEKGIAVLRFNAGWRSRKFVLDDFKYDEEATGKLLEIAKQKILELRSNEGDDGSR